MGIWDPPRPGETYEQQWLREAKAWNEAVSAWIPKATPTESSQFFGVDRTRTPERFRACEPWRWYHTLAYRVGCWLETLGRRVQGWAP